MAAWEDDASLLTYGEGGGRARIRSGGEPIGMAPEEWRAFAARAHRCMPRAKAKEAGHRSAMGLAGQGPRRLLPDPAAHRMRSPNRWPRLRCRHSLDGAKTAADADSSPIRTGSDQMAGIGLSTSFN